VEFKNEDNVKLYAIMYESFNRWKGNIEGINNKRLLNKMIKDGVFER
jgi:hypothetical protein